MFLRITGRRPELGTLAFDSGSFGEENENSGLEPSKLLKIKSRLPKMNPAPAPFEPNYARP